MAAAFPAMSMSQSLTGTQSVKSFGAMADGSHDDSAAIQAAINAAGAAGGGIVLLPPGTYKVGTGLTITSPKVHLRGSGIDATTISSHTSGATFTVNSSEGSLADFTVGPGSGVTRAAGSYEFAIAYLEQSSIERIRVASQGGLCWGAFDFTSSGSNSTSALYCSKISAQDVPRFANFSDVNDIYFHQCIGSSSTLNGTPAPMVELSGPHQEAIVFTDCDFIAANGVNSCCLHFGNANSRYCKFNGVYFDSAPTGVIIDAGSQVDFNGCWFSNRPGDGLVVNGGDNVHVVGGQAYNGGARGIAFLGGWGHLAQGVAIVSVGETTPSPGIEIGAACTGARVLGCSAASSDARFAGAISTGLRIDAGATNVIADHNDFHLCGSSIANNAASNTIKIGSNNL